MWEHDALWLSMKAARRWNILPEHFLELSARNRALMEGETYLAEQMGALGFPAFISQDPQHQGEFEAVTRQDFAREALDAAQAMKSRLEPGEEWIVRFNPHGAARTTRG